MNGKSSVSSEFMDEISTAQNVPGSFPGRGIRITLIAIMRRFCEEDVEKVGELRPETFNTPKPGA